MDLDEAMQNGLSSSSSNFSEDEQEDWYSRIIEATSSLSKLDPRYGLVSGMFWWILNRRRRAEQKQQRKMQFNRRLRQLINIRCQLQQNALRGLSLALKEMENPILENLEDLPDKRVWVKSNEELNRSNFWMLLDKDELPLQEYLEYFHMRNDTFDFLYKRLEEHLTKTNTSMRCPIPAKKRLAATLYRLATNAEYLKVAKLFGIGKSTTTSLIRDVCEVLVKVLRDEFLSPNFLQFEEPKNVFDIEQVVGVLGSINVYILVSFFDWEETSPSPYSSLYGDDSHSLIFQAVVDHQGCFKHVAAKSPGGMRNLEAMDSSSLFTEVGSKLLAFEKVMNDIKVPGLLVADDSYSNDIPWILTPIRSNDTVDENGKSEWKKEDILNEKINKALTVFEDAMRKVKSRWKIIHGKNGKINFNADVFESIAMACCILHNICETREDKIDPSLQAQKSLFLRREEMADKDKSMECEEEQKTTFAIVSNKLN